MFPEGRCRAGRALKLSARRSALTLVRPAGSLRDVWSSGLHVTSADRCHMQAVLVEVEATGSPSCSAMRSWPELVYSSVRMHRQLGGRASDVWLRG
jgi:hypothetical protein